MATHILVGTRKTAFIYTSDEARRDWQLSEPMLPGWRVLHMAADTRSGTPRLYAAANHDVWGPSVAKSEDGGETWEQRSTGLAFPDDMGLAIDTVWKVTPGTESEHGVVYAGTSPAGLFRSEDWGVTWVQNEAINRHDYRAFWQPVAGGPATPEAQRVTMSLHSIEIDPRDAKRMLMAISGGGSYLTEDGGETWHGIDYFAGRTSFDAESFVSQGKAKVPPGVDPAAAHDMHSMRLDQKQPDRVWSQSHTGVYYSADSGGSWQNVSAGLPSEHGFPIAVSRRDPDAVYVVPLEVGEANFRVCPGQFAVYRTRDSGTTWDRLTDGLPGPNDYQSAYREALDTDGLDPEGVYVGTSNGHVYASLDGGDRWQALPGTLPPVLSVTCAVY